MTAFLALIVAALAVSQSPPATRPAVDPAAVAQAQGRDKLPPDAVFHGKITVSFGPNKMLDGAELWFRPSGAVVRLEAGGATAVADGKTAWVSPADAKMAKPRFQLYTWPYFAMVPFKLDDSGVNLAPMPPAPMSGDKGKAMARAKMTFAAGTGDAPDDWYVLYVDGQNRLKAMAYIVTYGTDTAEAEKEPHAIVYDDFRDVPGPDGRPTGVTVPTRWSFRHWSIDAGVGEQEIGSATLSGLELVAPPAGAFDVPPGAREVPAPG